MENHEMLDDFKELGSNDQFEDYRKVDNGVRLANFVIDRIVLFGLATMAEVMTASSNFAVLLITGYFTTFAYYSICEGLFNGKTIGKLITSTRAIYDNGMDLDFGAAMSRSICRIVPFEPFSFFGDHGWHDSWSGTMVVSEKEYQIKKLSTF